MASLLSEFKQSLKNPWAEELIDLAVFRPIAFFFVKLCFRMSSNIEQLEQQLDSFDAAKRKDALAKLWDLAQSGKIALAEPGVRRISKL